MAAYGETENAEEDEEEDENEHAHQDQEHFITCMGLGSASLSATQVEQLRQTAAVDTRQVHEAGKILGEASMPCWKPLPMNRPLPTCRLQRLQEPNSSSIIVCVCVCVCVCMCVFCI